MTSKKTKAVLEQLWEAPIDSDPWQNLLWAGAVVQEQARKTKGKCNECQRTIPVGTRCVVFHAATTNAADIKDTYVVLDLDCWEEFRHLHDYEPSMVKIQSIARKALAKEARRR